MVGNDIKLPIFNENGLEDPQKHCFLCEFVQTVRQVQNEAIKGAQMITTLRGRALEWYMKFSVVSRGFTHKKIDQIRARLIDEFRNPKFESQCITQIKDINKLPTEFVWDFDQRFKKLMAKVIFHMLDVQHKEWFIASLLPHIQILLMQQNIVSQIEALVIAMKLESSPIGEIGAGMMHIQ